MEEEIKNDVMKLKTKIYDTNDRIICEIDNFIYSPSGTIFLTKDDDWYDWEIADTLKNDMLIRSIYLKDNR